MHKILKNIFYRSLIVVLCVQLMGCGTLLYPERRGQKAGHLDAGVVILDAIGLLFFLIPGIIAFAIDFSNGTIYVPAGPLQSNLKEINFDPKHTSIAQIEGLIKKQTGQTVKLNQENIRVSKMHSIKDMKYHFAQTHADAHRIELALNNL